MAAKKAAKKSDAANQPRKPERKKVEVKDLDTKKNPKGSGGSFDAVVKL